MVVEAISRTEVKIEVPAPTAMGTYGMFECISEILSSFPDQSDLTIFFDIAVAKLKNENRFELGGGYQGISWALLNAVNQGLITLTQDTEGRPVIVKNKK